ncbi:S8 family serine peptidase [candidate division KSB1 bacterium]|nr:S8 family serine peptidase [candidate division KSB1 bacterium]
MRGIILFWMMLFGLTYNSLLIASNEDIFKPAMIVLREPNSIPGKELSRYKTKQERHEFVIRKLRKNAEKSQNELVHFLDKMKRLNKVREYEPFWLVNAISLVATDAVIDSIRNRDDVLTIYSDQEIDIDVMVPINPRILLKSNSWSYPTSPALRTIKADCLWNKGINGAGTLVCNIDTGVNGLHPMLYYRWKGLMGARSSECWFDPFTFSNFPIDDHQYGHGTMTMGLITGMIPEDTIGVAFGAQWIAANAIEERVYTYELREFNHLRVFQWAADPDENPATVADVPDVINYSLDGSFHRCINLNWDVIDAAELAGAVVIVSAGNNGKYGDFSVGYPASRATSPVNTFSVGAIDNNCNIAVFSSRGSSICDSISIKPEVVAPGVDIRSSSLGDGYSADSGTSYSTAYVSGAVALLRQVNQDATVSEIKYALLNSAIDLGPEGEDNSYGRGLIDINAAAKLLSAPVRPNINMSKFLVNNKISNLVVAGTNHQIASYFINTGTLADNVTAILSTNDAYTKILNGVFSMGTMERWQIKDNLKNPFSIYVPENASDGHDIIFDLRIFENDSLININNFVLTINQECPIIAVESTNLIINSKKNNIKYTEILLENRGSQNLEFDINEYPDQPENVLSSSMDPNLSNPMEFKTVIDDPIEDLPGHYKFDIKQINAAFADTFITFECYDSTTGGELTGEYFSLILEIVFHVQEIKKIGGCLSIFFDVDQDVATGTHPPQREHSTFFLTTGQAIGAEYYIDVNNQVQDPRAVFRDIDRKISAVLPIEKDGIRTRIILPFYLLKDDGNLNISAVLEGSEMDENKWALVDLAPDRGKGIIGIDKSPVPWLTVFPATGVIHPGCKTKIWVETDATHLNNYIYKSLIRITSNDRIIPIINIPVTLNVGKNAKPLIPETMSVSQNYPNPFNATTTVTYQITGKNHVSINIFNINGALVRNLVNEELNAGYYTVQWDGKNNRNQLVSSGIYLYRLKSDNTIKVKKMILLR